MDKVVLDALTLLVPFYRNVGMLRRQIEEWNKYPAGMRIILVDDCSPEPAVPIVKELASDETRARLEVYRTEVDIPWSREFARNLATNRAPTDWVLHIDIDHILPAEHIPTLQKTPISRKRWYRFRRCRVGKADETRKKDQISPDCEFGEIHPHIDSYLCRTKNYWKAGGYNEAFCGVLGGGNEFLRRLEKHHPVELFPGNVCLHVYTRHVIDDASDRHCDRDTKPGKDLWRQLQRHGVDAPEKHLTLPWSRVL